MSALPTPGEREIPTWDRPADTVRWADQSAGGVPERLPTAAPEPDRGTDAGLVWAARERRHARPSAEAGGGRGVRGAGGGGERTGAGCGGARGRDGHPSGGEAALAACAVHTRIDPLRHPCQTRASSPQHVELGATFCGGTGSRRLECLRRLQPMWSRPVRRASAARTDLPARAVPANVGPTDESAAAQGESSSRSGTPARGRGARRRPHQDAHDRVLHPG